MVEDCGEEGGEEEEGEDIKASSKYRPLPHWTLKGNISSANSSRELVLIRSE